jgi:hypothetical protein
MDRCGVLERTERERNAQKAEDGDLVVTGGEAGAEVR